MSLPVHLVPSLEGVGVGATVVVEGDEAHHAVAVRRLRVGERLVLTDGLGRSVLGEVAATGKRTLDVRVHEATRDPEPSPSVTVVQALPKGDRGELAVEVLTEVGVARVVPWSASRSVAAGVAKPSTSTPGASRAPSTAFGPSARNSRRSERTERRLSLRASLTRVLPATRGAEGPEGPQEEVRPKPPPWGR